MASLVGVISVIGPGAARAAIGRRMVAMAEKYIMSVPS